MIVESLADLDKFEGKYVDIRLNNGEGMRCWVAKIDAPEMERRYEAELNEKPRKTIRYVCADYGIAMPVAVGDEIEEIDPVENDPGPIGWAGQ
jgi:hypothetical protein